jgi:hypothetical protein
VKRIKYFIFLSPERVPTLDWTRVTLFGKLAGRLVNPGEIRKGGLLGLPALFSRPESPTLRSFASELTSIRDFWVPLSLAI